uniref:APC membrane recruitment protein 1-like n=1 Tax=Myxine glutinosa TaxID=7769 RepID=UPI00358EE870
MADSDGKKDGSSADEAEENHQLENGEQSKEGDHCKVLAGEKEGRFRRLVGRANPVSALASLLGRGRAAWRSKQRGLSRSATASDVGQTTSGCTGHRRARLASSLSFVSGLSAETECVTEGGTVSELPCPSPPHQHPALPSSSTESKGKTRRGLRKIFGRRGAKGSKQGIVPGGDGEMSKSSEVETPKDEKDCAYLVVSRTDIEMTGGETPRIVRSTLVSEVSGNEQGRESETMESGGSENGSDGLSEIFGDVASLKSFDSVTGCGEGFAEGDDEDQDATATSLALTPSLREPCFFPFQGGGEEMAAPPSRLAFCWDVSDLPMVDDPDLKMLLNTPSHTCISQPQLPDQDSQPVVPSDTTPSTPPISESLTPFLITTSSITAQMLLSSNKTLSSTIPTSKINSLTSPFETPPSIQYSPPISPSTLPSIVASPPNQNPSSMQPSAPLPNQKFPVSNLIVVKSSEMLQPTVSRIPQHMADDPLSPPSERHTSDEGYYDSTTPGYDDELTGASAQEPSLEPISRDSTSGDALFELFSSPVSEIDCGLEAQHKPEAWPPLPRCRSSHVNRHGCPKLGESDRRAVSEVWDEVEQLLCESCRQVISAEPQVPDGPIAVEQCCSDCFLLLRGVCGDGGHAQAEVLPEVVAAERHIPPNATLPHRIRPSFLPVPVGSSYRASSSPALLKPHAHPSGTHDCSSEGHQELGPVQHGSKRQPLIQGSLISL